MNNIEDLAKIIASNLDSQPWETKNQEDKQSFMDAASAVLAEIISPFKGSVVHFLEDEEGEQPYRLSAMNKREWEKLWDTLGKNNSVPRRIDKCLLRNLPSFVENAISNSRSRENQSWNRLKSFQDDVLTFLRAIALIAETVGNASTHAEKSARLRGLISLLETSIEKTRGAYGDLLSDRWAENPDLFRSDYPVRKYIQQIHELQQENASLKGERPKSDDSMF